MLREVHGDFFTAFFLATLKKLVKDHPYSVNERALSLGNRCGQRMADDFFREHHLYEKTEDDKVVDKYVVLFFKHYMNIEILLVDKTVTIKETFSDYGGICGLWLLCGVLTSIFKHINSSIVFEPNGQSITYKYLY
ncbi:hypothetical protein PAEPH01_0900 [Pancytospora epiphaga]|nr:hypothetical protein PAEPH01_0900 [Pancytospora epiphaga]